MCALQRILCAVDESPCSRRALQHAVRLARQHHAALTVLTVHPLRLPPVLWPEYPVALPPAQPDPGASEERLRAFVAEVAGDLPFACEVSQGLVGIEILDRARDLSPELLVVGTSGRGALERPGAGSVAEHLIRHGTVPVLAVPEAAGATEVEDFHTLVVAIDFSLDAQAAVRFACRLLRGDGGEVVLTHVLEQFGGCFASTHGTVSSCVQL